MIQGAPFCLKSKLYLHSLPVFRSSAKGLHSHITARKIIINIVCNKSCSETPLVAYSVTCSGYVKILRKDKFNAPYRYIAAGITGMCRDCHSFHCLFKSICVISKAVCRKRIYCGIQVCNRGDKLSILWSSVWKADNADMASVADMTVMCAVSGFIYNLNKPLCAAFEVARGLPDILLERSRISTISVGFDTMSGSAAKDSLVSMQWRCSRSHISQTGWSIRFLVFWGILEYLQLRSL